MGINVKDRLFVDRSLRRFFLIPLEIELPPGDFEVRTAAGEARRVEPLAIEIFEIPRDSAIARLREDLDAALRQARDLFVSQVFDGPASPDDEARRAAWSTLLQSAPERLPQDPATLRAAMAALMSKENQAERAAALQALETQLAALAANPEAPALALGEKIREAEPALRAALLTLSEALREAASRLDEPGSRP